MVNLTPEQRQAVEQAGIEPVRLTDPETNDAYYLLKEEIFERVRDVIQPKPAVDLEFPEGIRRSKEAFLRDLPELMKLKSRRRKWAAYHGDERIGLATTETELYQECFRRGLKEEEFYVGQIGPHSREPEQIDPSLFEFGEFIPDDPQA
jgi:hypothetical protein